MRKGRRREPEVHSQAVTDGILRKLAAELQSNNHQNNRPPEYSNDTRDQEVKDKNREALDALYREIVDNYNQIIKILSELDSEPILKYETPNGTKGTVNTLNLAQLKNSSNDVRFKSPRKPPNVLYLVSMENPEGTTFAYIPYAFNTSKIVETYAVNPDMTVNLLTQTKKELESVALSYRLNEILKTCLECLKDPDNQASAINQKPPVAVLGDLFKLLKNLEERSNQPN